MNENDREAIDRIYDEFFSYLDGDAPRPDLSHLADDVTAELEAIESAARVSQNVDVDMIPEFESDPVAVRLGFRSGVDEQRVSGGALAEARRRRELSPEELAARASAKGVTVTAADITGIEAEPWSTTASRIVEALAAALEVEEHDAGWGLQGSDRAGAGSLLDVLGPDGRAGGVHLRRR